MASSQKPQGLARVLGLRRLGITLLFSGVLGALVGLHWTTGPGSAAVRALLVGLVALGVFGLFERWPRRLPRWLARWVLQVLGVAAAVPVTTFALFALSTPAGAPPFWRVAERVNGFLMLSVVGLLFAPWVALAALVRQKDALARHQALAFDLERSELERRALDARLRLLQAQVSPHFLFNTLANVRELVDAGAPQASQVLGSLIAYLRAAVPRLQEPATTLGQELELVRAYLELMHMRMPDRLQYALHADEAALALPCPPMTLLTLVENAVRHGIDPSEEGGHIEVRVTEAGGRCRVQVSDTGVGLGRAEAGLGTGLSTLRERLQLVFGPEAQLQLAPLAPHGVRAEVQFPSRGSGR
ncbi:sensor histidine kinase [Aggregicoccus sp. 17bor-14]|nr:histidine kinase [Simulacricoccus sp. 17bor-14]MRI91603.1 sensor histidine kinase [Aggregicoccus sp. 17bor-14]